MSSSLRYPRIVACNFSGRAFLLAAHAWPAIRFVPLRARPVLVQTSPIPICTMRYGLTIIRRLYGRVAQLVEQRTENPRVVGSIPTPATIFSIACRP